MPVRPAWEIESHVWHCYETHNDNERMFLDRKTAGVEIKGQYPQWNIPLRKFLPCATKGVDE